MSGIINRTIFMVKGTDGFHRFSDFARVTTGIGVMWEQRQDNRFAAPSTAFRWDEEMSRIDDVQPFDPYGAALGEGTIGGTPMPKGGV
jgi:hypothetical protein